MARSVTAGPAIDSDAMIDAITKNRVYIKSTTQDARPPGLTAAVAVIPARTIILRRRRRRPCRHGPGRRTGRLGQVPKVLPLNPSPPPSDLIQKGTPRGRGRWGRSAPAASRPPRHARAGLCQGGARAPDARRLVFSPRPSSSTSTCPASRSQREAAPPHILKGEPPRVPSSAPFFIKDGYTKRKRIRKSQA